MIFLFSNRTYGLPFLDAAARYARRTHTPITAIFSGHRLRERQDGGPVGALRSLAAKWRGSKELAAAGLPYGIVDDVNAPAFVDSIEPHDVGIIAGFDQIFGARAIGAFRSFVNVHPSLLPYYRGPEPAYWCIENQETTTGFTIHAVTTKIDCGEVLYQETLAIDPHEDAGSLTARIALLAVPALERWLAHVAEGTPWVKRKLDAARIYHDHVDYKSFREAGAPRK